MSSPFSWRWVPALGLAAALAGCAGEPPPAPSSAPPPAASAPAARPTLARSTPEPGVVLEPLSIVTPTATYDFQVEIADEESERQRGLMFRRTMARDRGMLFLFQGPPQEQAFWMKNTPLPLDILYIQPSGVIYSIARNTTPFSETPVPSGGPVTAVLELNGGLAAELGVQTGDRVRHRAFPSG
jgi:hypothetical protein